MPWMHHYTLDHSFMRMQTMAVCIKANKDNEWMEQCCQSPPVFPSKKVISQQRCTIAVSTMLVQVLITKLERKIDIGSIEKISHRLSYRKKKNQRNPPKSIASLNICRLWQRKSLGKKNWDHWCVKTGKMKFCPKSFKKIEIIRIMINGRSALTLQRTYDQLWRQCRHEWNMCKKRKWKKNLP